MYNSYKLIMKQTKQISRYGRCLVGVAVALAGIQAYGGNCFHASVSYPSQSAGMYKFGLSEYGPEQLKRNIFANGGGIANDNYYYAVRYEEIGGLPVVERNTYSLRNWSVEDSFPNGSVANVATDLAYDYYRDEAYGCFMNPEGEGYIFGKYRFGYFLPDPICNMQIAFAAMDFDSRGTLYAIDWMGRLLTVDTQTGDTTTVGDTGLTTTAITGGAIDPDTDIMYYSVMGEAESAIYKIDLSTANAEKLYVLENNEQVCGLYFPRTYDSAAPAASANPTLNFSGFSLEGSVRFRAPQKSYGGEPLTNNTLDYHILANGVDVATGKASYEDGFISVPVSLPKAGKYCFSLYFSNEAGNGPRSKVSQYVGPDIPKAPGSPRLTYNNGTVKVFWTASPSTGVNGGSIDRSSMYYKIIRMPDGEEYQAEASGWSQIIEEPEERTQYSYLISAVAGGLESECVETPSFALGKVMPPFAETFPAQTSAFGWKWINNESYDLSDQYSTANGLRLVTMNAPDEGVFLISPGMIFKKDHTYNLSLMLKRGNSNYEEYVDLVMGKTYDADGLSETLIAENILLDSSEFQTMLYKVEPAEDGVYYIALRSRNSGRMVYLKEFSVSSGVAGKAPGAVSGLVGDAASDGSCSASFSFVLPTVDRNGNPLQSIDGLELWRDGQLVKYQEGEYNPGERAEIVDDTMPEKGRHNYGIACCNKSGSGELTPIEVFVGFNFGFPPEWVSVVETDVLGTVDISWAPADEDIDGKSLIGADVSYNIYDRSGELIRKGVKDTSLTVRACEPSAPQDWVQYRVAVVTDAGIGEKSKSMLVPVGVPDVAPWSESFASKSATHIIGTTENSVGDTWQVVGGFSYNGREVDPQDGDNGMMGLDNVLMDEPVAMFTGKIDLSKISAPAFSFWVYNYVGDNGKENENVLHVKAWSEDEGRFIDLNTVVIGETGPAHQWNKVVVPLDAFEGKTVRMRLEATVVTSIYVHIDNLRVDTDSECNLAALELEAQSWIEPEVEFPVNLKVRNSGRSKVESFKAYLLENGNVVNCVEGPALNPDQAVAVTFMHSLSRAGSESVVLSGLIEADGDMISSDNVSNEVEILSVRNGLPEPKNLYAESTDTGIELKWETPDLSTVPTVCETESFEGSKSWGSDVEDWIFLDLDRATIGGFGKKELPVSGQQSFFVADDTHAQLNYPNDGTRFKAHSGNKSLWSMYSMRGSVYVKSDDWAITPELYGGPQIASLWASSFLADPGQTQYLESFEVLGSYTDTNPENFKLIKAIDNVPAQWTNYEFYLPDGVRYMAIRGVSYDKQLLMVDDISFRKLDASPEAVNVCGYRIWRNGECVATLPKDKTLFSDTEVSAGQIYSYSVSALYDSERESSLSYPVSIKYDNVSAVGAVDENPCWIRIVKNGVEITAAKGTKVMAYSCDGVLQLSETQVSPSQEYSLPSGIYIITDGHRTAKVSLF